MNKRARSTKAAVQKRKDALLIIVREMKPMTVRQVFYQATVHGIVDKTEAGYRIVQNDLVNMRVAVTPEQIEQWSLPSRPTKLSDSRSKGFGDISVELDAIPPHNLRALVETLIQNHLPPEQFDILKAAEQSERQLINGLVGMLDRDGHLDA
jgi:hypothetical protein